MEAPRIPKGALTCRPYDLAATERSQVQKSPDATTSCQVSKCKDGFYYLSGYYCDGNIDEETGVKGRLCMRVGARDNIMLKQAAWDGDEVVIVCPQDPAAAGKQVFNEMAKKFTAAGYRFKKDPMPINKAKLTKFLPFADACENGLVYIVKDSFDKVTYEFIMKELESFDGERSTSTRHDDFPDCISSGFNWLCNNKIRKQFGLPSSPNSDTALKAHKSRIK